MSDTVEVDVKKKKYYYDEEYVNNMIFEYQKTAVVMNGVVVNKNERLERKIIEEVQKVVNAIINQYSYWRFEPIEDLKQEGIKACFMSFMKFHPSKGSSFNLFSIITKKHLLNYTDRRKKHRNLNDVDECLDLECSQDLNYDMFFDNFEDVLFRVIDENFVGNKRKKFIKIASVIIDYLRKTQKYSGKSDLYAWCRSYGFKSIEVREFIKEIGEFYDDISILVA